MAIEFTQFLRPDGRQTTVSIERPKAIESKAQELVRLGCRFEIEALTTGQASIECLGPDDADGDPVSLAIEIVPNGPEVPGAVDRVVEEALDALREATR